ncbi:snRNA-activating protein complex subunit 4 [Venturia canescens]|uniref:snRNA-activating protein complex subunit 4 n=1 Tax=Venturia canescens TaxID=32260 RepID=UPI001C9D341B|nr:snRNA-activating protein complex subunit 4 [Venturia canescens]
MSDLEDDREFLDDIKALEDVLANEHETPIAKHLEEDVSVCNPVSNRRGNTSSQGFGEVECDEQRENIRSEIDENQTAYETNKKLIELLKETRRELVTLLERCRENKAILDEKIRMKARVTKGSKVLICTAGMPYFKDGKQYPAPWNNDVKKKQKNEELQVVHLRTTCPWTPKDRNILWRAIRHQAASEVLDREMADTDDISTENPDDRREKQNPDEALVDKDRRRLKKPLDLPKNFREMVGPLGSREFDWLKISVSDFDGRHTADECKVMWQVFLHPDINRYKWTRDEDERLKTLVEKYQAENWTEIAIEMKSRRSGYQCFLRFNTISRIPSQSDVTWNKKEDEWLCRCVEKFKIGNYIPWGIVSRYMHGKTKAQIYYRYMNNTNPNLKKGRFTREEDEKLVEAVKKYGENWGQISHHCFSNRSGVQLNDHYQTLKVRKQGLQNAWSLNEDARLLFLYNKFGADWSKIASRMSGKTRTQVRHRHSAIVRYWDKGVSLYEIPRKYKQQKIIETPEVNVEDDDFIESTGKNRVANKNNKATSEMELIDLELMKYFQVMPPALRPGRKRKYYSKDELQEVTRKLCIILKCLGANLDIPEDLDDTELTEKEKQLLKSLKDYQQMQINRANSRSLEYLGDSRDAGGLHFSPVCSGNCNTVGKLQINEKLDYAPPAKLDHCQMTLKMQLETPENILEILGKDINDDFEKISKIMNFADINQRKSKFVTKIYVLGPEQISKILPNVLVETVPRNCATKIPPADEVPKKRSKKKEKPWNSSSSEGIIQRLDQPITCIEPNFYTLRALKYIMSKSETSGENSRSNQEPAQHSSMSREAKISMNKLKERLVQLFKYPIGLSYIIKPDDTDGATNSQWISAEDTNVDDNEDSVVSLPSKKKKRC